MTKQQLIAQIEAMVEIFLWMIASLMVNSHFYFGERVMPTADLRNYKLFFK